MKLNISLMVIAAVAAFAFSSCGTGASLFFGPKGIEVIPPAENVVVPTQPIIKASK
jgi:hypothetical protein